MNWFRNLNTSLSFVLTSIIVLLVLTVGADPKLLAQSATEKEILTNADVVKMVQAHLSADVIVQQIEQNAGNYALTTNRLIQLKQAGVPDKVIAAMQTSKAGSPNAKKKAPTDAHSPEKAAGPQPSAPTEYSWEVKDVVDRMTDQHHFEGYLDQHPIPGTAELMQVKATCDATGMQWLMGKRQTNRIWK